MRVRILALAALCCVGVSSHAPASNAPEGWWRPEPVGYQKTLQLTTAQTRHIERLFQAFDPWLKIDLNELVAAESAFLRRADARDPDNIALRSAAERLAVARTRLALTRNTLSLQVGRVLTAEQRVQLVRLRVSILE